MKTPKLTMRARILLVLLAIVAAFWIQMTVYTWHLERGLKVVAEAKMHELNMDLKVRPSLDYAFHLVPRVTVAREYLIFGPTHGKVHIFLRITSSEGEEKFGAFDYFYERNEGRWKETESGYCGDRESQLEARAIFSSLRG